MWIQKCDVCGEEKRGMSRFRYKIKVEKEVFCWEDHWWEKLDICEDCQKRIIELVKQRKEKTDGRLLFSWSEKGGENTMKCNYPIWSPVCSFHYNGECLREHNYECPALAMKNLSHGEMVQIAEEKKNKTPRYIDANKLIDLATHEGAYGYVDVHDIYNAPTADVVAVVRCRECKYWDYKKLMCECPEWADMGGWHKCSDADDYCFRAERKEKTDAEIH